MNRMAGRVAAVVSVIFLFGGVEPAGAFSFCFSFGSDSRQQSRYADYPPPYPVAPPGSYGAYPYSPLQFDPYYGSYYPPLSAQPYDGGTLTPPQEYR
jgi:hypothetical protein